MHENFYGSPQDYGLVTVGEVEWCGAPYSFDLTGVWYNPQTGQLYWADDAGCSCPSPFEGIAFEELSTGSADDLGGYLRGRLEHAAGRVADLMLRIKSRPRMTSDAEGGPDSNSTLNDEAGDEPIPDSRETCWFWDSRAGECRYEMLFLGCEPCADCPVADERLTR